TDQTAEFYTLKSSNMNLIDFNDVTPGELIEPDRYASQGVYAYPSSDELIGSGSPCNGSFGIQTNPFTGPYFIFNFDNFIVSVSVEAGDGGPSDSDEMTLTAYSGLDGTGDVLGSATAYLAQGDPTGCELIELTGLTGARSITVKSVSFYDEDPYPNSIYIDNLYFESIEVTVDIKPGSYPNSINCMNDNALIPVAILSTEDFDALTIDHTTVLFEGASEWHTNKMDGTLKRHEEDVNGDGLMDLVFHFKYMETNLDCYSTVGALIGQTYDGVYFNGEDEVMMFIPGE
ncbi:MAG: hypothetical protein P8100_08725, partial [bacterium]